MTLQFSDPSPSQHPAARSTNTHPNATKEPIRHMVFGSLAGVQQTIRTLHSLGYAEPNEWSRPMPTGRPGEIMAILTKHRIKENQ